MELQNKRKNNLIDLPIGHVGRYFLCLDNLSLKYQWSNYLKGAFMKHRLFLYYYVKTNQTYSPPTPKYFSENYINLQETYVLVQQLFLLQITEKKVLSNKQNKTIFSLNPLNKCYIIQNSLNFSNTHTINHNYIYRLTVSVREIDSKQPVMFSAKTKTYSMKDALDITAIN